MKDPPESLRSEIVEMINYLVELHNDAVREKNKDPQVETMRSKLQTMRSTPLSFISWMRGKHTHIEVLDIDEEVGIKSQEAKIMSLFQDFLVKF
jgi:hypothetical protein